MMFDYESSDKGSLPDEFKSQFEEEDIVDAHWLQSSSTENELDSPITVMEKSCVFNYHEGPE